MVSGAGNSERKSAFGRRRSENKSDRQRIARAEARASRTPYSRSETSVNEAWGVGALDASKLLCDSSAAMEILGEIKDVAA